MRVQGGFSFFFPPSSFPCAAESMWPRGSNSWRVSRSASQFPGDDWQLSCLHGCGLIFVRIHLFDGGSEARPPPVTGDGFLCNGALQRRNGPQSAWNYVAANLIAFGRGAVYFPPFIVPLVMHCGLLHHVIMLLLLQKQCSMNLPLDLQ